MSQQCTHVAFNDGIRVVLEAVARPGPASVVLATHNAASVAFAAAEMQRLGLDRNHPRVHMAQVDWCVYVRARARVCVRERERERERESFAR